MELYGCQIRCKCGGHVEVLIDGVYYLLTEKYTIIFRGICNSCGDDVAVERDILSLMVMCPNKKGEKGN